MKQTLFESNYLTVISIEATKNIPLFNSLKGRKKYKKKENDVGDRFNKIIAEKNMSKCCIYAS